MQTHDTRPQPIQRIVAITLVLLLSLLGPPVSFDASVASAMQQQECSNDLAECMPEGIVLEGCWECEMTYAVKFRGVDVTIICTSVPGTTAPGKITIRGRLSHYEAAKRLFSEDGLCINLD